MPSPLSLSGPSYALAHASLEEHPLRKCLSQRLLAAEKAASFDHIEEPRHCQNLRRESGCCEEAAKISKRSKKKRSWTASFVSGGGRKGGGKAEPPRRADTMELVEEVVAAKFGAATAKKPLGPSLSWDPQQQLQRSGIGPIFGKFSGNKEQEPNFTKILRNDQKLFLLLEFKKNNFYPNSSNLFYFYQISCLLIGQSMFPFTHPF